MDLQRDRSTPPPLQRGGSPAAPDAPPLRAVSISDAALELLSKIARSPNYDCSRNNAVTTAIGLQAFGLVTLFTDIKNRTTANATPQGLRHLAANAAARPSFGRKRS